MTDHPTPDAGAGLAETVATVGKEWEELRRQVAEGFHGAHCRASGHAAKTLETASFLYALVELLSEEGVVAIDELDDRKRAVFERQKQRYANDRMGVILQDSREDKYAFDRTAEIDCENRVHLCKASCCRLPFALSRQDIEERVVRWNLGVPYMIEQGEDGYCTHHAAAPAAAPSTGNGRCRAAATTAARTGASGSTSRSASRTRHSNVRTG